MHKRISFGWIVSIASFFVIAMNAMALIGFGVFLKPLTEEFGWDRGDLSSVFSIAVLIGGILSIFSGRLCDRFSPRIMVTAAGISLGIAFLATSRVSELWQLYFAYAIPVGLTIALTVIPINAMIPKWFTRGRGLAMSIPAMGFSVGGVVAPLVVERLIAGTGWQNAFLILGILPFVITVPLAQLMKNPPDETDSAAFTSGTETKKDPAKKLSVKEIIRNKWLWAFCGMQVMFGFSTQMIFVHIAPYGTDVGLTPAVAAGILSFSNLIGIFGNLAAGSLAEKVNPRLMLVGSYVLLTISLVLLIFTDNTTMFYIFAFLFGFARGSIALLQTLTAVEVFGVIQFGFYMGTFMLSGTTGGVIGTPVAGYIFDSTGSYTTAFLMAIVAGGLAIFITSLIYRHKTTKIC